MTLATVVVVAMLAMTLNSCKEDEPTTDPDQVAYDAADGVNGARLYDHVLNAKGITDQELQDHGNFFRCKVCHGWDLKGQKGVANGQGTTATKPAAAAVELVTEVRVNDGIREIYDHIVTGGTRDPYSKTYNDQMPDYSKLITSDDAWDLVKFIKETAHETDDFYTLNTTGTWPTGTHSFSDIGKGGDGTNGKVVYDAHCKVCHGADGSKLNIYCKGIWLGDMFRNDPHEIQHKAVWGMPNDWSHVQAGCADAGEMPIQTITDQDIRDLMVMGQDTVAFPDYH